MLARITLDREHAQLLVAALRDYASILRERPDPHRTGQAGQVAWLATYLEHTLRDQSVLTGR